jgi:hypothetical protein
MIRLTLFYFQFRWLAGRLFRRLCLLAVCILLAVLLLIFWHELLTRWSRFSAPQRRRRFVPKLTADQWKVRKAWLCWFKLREELSRQRAEQIREQWRRETIFLSPNSELKTKN